METEQQTKGCSKTIAIAASLATIIAACIAAIALIPEFGEWLSSRELQPTNLTSRPTTPVSTVSPAAQTVIAVIPPPLSTAPPPSCQPVLLAEDFNNPEDASAYIVEGVTSLTDGRLRFSISEAHTGESIPLFGQYEAFTLEFSVFPVGEIFDESVNILFLYHSGGWYEWQIRPRRHEFSILKVTRQNDQPDTIEGMGWTTSSVIDLGPTYTLIRLDVEAGRFALWINDQYVHTFEDENPYLRGQVRIGIGAGEVAPVTMEIDNLFICGH